MDQTLISKKELLQATGISYGQLYRWKRKGLIPEEWFVRKSTFTGQETFFPRDRIVARVERILGMKDEDLSLDDIAEEVTPDLSGISISLEEAVERRIVSAQAAEISADRRPEESTLRYGELLALYLVEKLLGTGDVSREECALVLDVLAESYSAFEGGGCDLVMVRKMGVATCLLVSSSAEVRFEPAAKVVARVNVQEAIEALGARSRE